MGVDMARKIIKCSRCDETFSSGLDYRWHFDKHIDEWWEAEDKQEYIKQTTTNIIINPAIKNK
jgi:uncharacterized C2H2 Zn-finger protein